MTTFEDAAVGPPASFEAATAGLPAGEVVSSAQVRAAVARSGRVVIAIDDDPTGTQAVADIPLVTSWTVDDLRWGLTQDRPCLFVLANTRSLRPEAAAQRVREIVRAAHAAGEAEGVPFVLLSRSDSTLRGHFPVETDAIDAELRSLSGHGADAVILCPAYIEAGRLTAGDTHWARVGEAMLPVAETEYARDSAFGYSHSDLREFVSEKTHGRVPATEVVSVSLRLIRAGSAAAVADHLRDIRDGRTVVINATTENDLRTVALALIALEQEGRRLIYRTGPSFVRARTGLEAQPPLNDLTAIYAEQSPAGNGHGAGHGRGGGDSPRHGLIVVGSHVPLSSRQLERARELDGLTAFEVDAAAVLAGDTDARDELCAALTRRAALALEDADVLLYTSRALVKSGESDRDGLEAAAAISRFLVALTRRICDAAGPGFCVAKGGITSNDLATAALDIRRAWVLGSLQPSLISVWRAVEGPAKSMPYVVFPGNVGDDDALREVILKLRGVHGR